jgi:tRNA(Ile)-lysidine synthase
VPNRNAAELTPTADQLARFRRDVEAITGETPTPARKLGLAVSGGSDSVAMLLLAAGAFRGAATAATVDHGLRPGAHAEAATVADLCARLQVPHAILPLPPEHSFAGNLQERARLGRYATLKVWAESDPATGWVAVAHQRNDVAESFLMRARRGAGVGGLAEMRRARPLADPVTGGKLLLRPLLDWGRDELRAIVGEAGISFAEDPSNQQPRFDRSRIRALLAATPDLPISRLAIAARNLRRAEDALEWLVERELPARFRTDQAREVRLTVADLPYELRRRFARIAVQHVRYENGLYDAWPATGLDRFVVALDAGETATIAGVRGRAAHSEWRFSLAPPRRSH